MAIFFADIYRKTDMMAKYPLTGLPEFAMMAVRVFYGKGSKEMKRKVGIILLAAAVLGRAEHIRSRFVALLLLVLVLLRLLFDNIIDVTY